MNDLRKQVFMNHANISDTEKNKNKKFPCFFAPICYSLIMKKKYYTSSEIIEYAERNNAVCTFASMSLRVLKGWTEKGQYEMKFYRVEPCVWRKELVRGKK